MLPSLQGSAWPSLPTLMTPKPVATEKENADLLVLSARTLLSVCPTRAGHFVQLLCVSRVPKVVPGPRKVASICVAMNGSHLEPAELYFSSSGQLDLGQTLDSILVKPRPAVPNGDVTMAAEFSGGCELIMLGVLNKRMEKYHHRGQDGL